MPRKPRVDANDAIHHVIARGNGGSSIVRDDTDRQALVARLAQVTAAFDWRMHAYCVMDNHLHLVVETQGPSLSGGMQRLVGGYAFAFNRRHGVFGHLFAGRFRSSLIELDTYALEACAYVVCNPLRACMVRAPEDWRWSSYRASAGLIAPVAFLETRIVPGVLHVDTRRACELYREFVRALAERPRPASGRSLTAGASLNYGPASG